MADELRDVHTKVNVETDALIDAIARVTNKERAEIARDVLHRWASEQLAIHSLTAKRLEAEGVPGRDRA